LDTSPNNLDQKLLKLKKPSFLSAFWDSCFNLSFYATATKASWGHIAFHTFILSLLIAISFSIVTFLPLKSNLQNLFKDLPVIQIKNGQASFDKNLKLPFVEKFPKSGANKLYYIVDSGENLKKIEEAYPKYVVFSKEKIVFFDGKQRIEKTYLELEKDPSIQMFFGKPLVFSPNNLANFTTNVSIWLVGFLFFGIVLVLLPLFNCLAAFISSVADKWEFSFADIFKLASFAATPLCLIQAFGCFGLRNGNYLLFLISLSWIVQIAYLIKGLKILRASKE
jgi:hypothetical protein